MQAKGDETILRVKAYVRSRLREEINGKPRGAAAAVSRALKTSSAHLANLTSEPPLRTPGEAFCRKAAKYWGLSYSELERLACDEPGGDMVPSVSGPPSALALPATLDELRQLLREEIAAALSEDRRDRPIIRKNRTGSSK